LESFQIFKTEIKRSKTYSGWCPFQGISIGTTLVQIQFGRTVPLNFQLPIFVIFAFFPSTRWTSWSRSRPRWICSTSRGSQQALLSSTK
jgi:hypothetical protein